MIHIRMGRFNARIQHGLGAAALALIALVGVMIWLTIRASDNLEGAIGASLRQLEQFANRIAALPYSRLMAGRWRKAMIRKL